MNEFERAIASGQPLDPAGGWTEDTILAAAAVLYHAVLKKVAERGPGARTRGRESMAPTNGAHDESAA
jgi:hypothetical protein